MTSVLAIKTDGKMESITFSGNFSLVHYYKLPKLLRVDSAQDTILTIYSPDPIKTTITMNDISIIREPTPLILDTRNYIIDDIHAKKIDEVIIVGDYKQAAILRNALTAADKQLYPNEDKYAEFINYAQSVNMPATKQIAQYMKTHLGIDYEINPDNPIDLAMAVYQMVEE